jgi:hypothetical protein
VNSDALRKFLDGSPWMAGLTPAQKEKPQQVEVIEK